jgi:hypothetical protein
MNLTTLNGKSINVSSYHGRMLDNLRNGRDIFEQTPIGKKQDGEWFWCIDIGKFKDLTKSSVENLIKELKLVDNSRRL